MKSPIQKAAWLVLTPAVMVTAVLATLVAPWFRHRPDLGATVLVVSMITTSIWMLLIWLALHRLVFQLAALWPFPASRLSKPEAAKCVPRFGIFYTTCDDFVAESFLSCVWQNYPEDAFKVFVCDDSMEPRNQASIDALCSGHERVTIVRRSDRSGFKAGNLNHSFKLSQADAFDWIVVVDADQMLSSEFLNRLADDVAAAPEHAACIQAVPQWQENSMLPPSGPFQQTMEEDTRLVLNRDLPWRSHAGFYPCLGRVAAIRASAWNGVGGFPECVSEDYAFAMEARNKGFVCIPAGSASLYDRGPRDFAAFGIQLSKYAAGTSELICHSYFKFLRGPAHWVEKLDATLWLTGYASMPLVLLNLPLSAWLAHVVWQQQLSLLPPGLASIFVGMTLLNFPVLVSVTDTIGGGTHRFFWTFAIYNAALPVAAVSFVRHFWKRPVFRRTPKGNHPASSVRAESCLTVLVGMTFTAMALWWHSPFSLLIGSVAAAQLLFPLLQHLHTSSGTGSVARTLVWLPGILFVTGVLDMWLRGSC